MDDELKKIIKAIRNIKLGEGEKKKMRASIIEKAFVVKIEEGQNIIQTGFARVYKNYQNILGYYFISNKYKFISTIVLLLFIVSCGGTSAFAERAVPGDLLYGIKLSVNEPIIGMFAFTKEKKTEWQERLVERRFDEAQKLVVQNNLNKNKRIYLENAIQKQVYDFNASVDALAIQKKESAHSSEIKNKLQATLVARQNILSNLSKNENVNAETKHETEQLLSTLTKSQNKTRNENRDAESWINTKTVPATKEEIKNNSAAESAQDGGDNTEEGDFFEEDFGNKHRNQSQNDSENLNPKNSGSEQ